MDAVQNELDKRGYAVLQQLSEGGMGVIFTVHHRDLDEIRVAKTVHEHLAASTEIQERFKDEAKKLAAVRHQNIALLFDFSAKPDAMFSIMEYIDGVTLAQLLEKQKRPSVGMALEIAIQALRALGFLHRIGYIHRDVAPDNLMLTKDPDGRPLVKLIDLGIAKDAARKTVRTMSGSFLGKLRYAAPEQFESADKVTPASDLYSFAVVLYEFITGVLPVRGNSETELMAGHCLHPPRAFEETDPEGRVPEELRSLLLQGLDKDPANRPASAKDLVKALQPLRDGSSVEEEELDGLLDLTGGAGGSAQIGSTVGPVEQLRAEADKAEQEGDLTTALEMLRRLVDFMPDDADLKQRIEALEGRSEDVHALRAQVSEARTLLHDRRYEDARRKLDTLIAEVPGHEDTQHLTAEIQQAAAGLLDKARQLRADGLYREALDRTSEALELAPQSKEARDLQEQVQRERRRNIEELAGEIQERLTAVGDAVELPDDEVSAGDLAEREADLQQARAKLERLAELDPEHPSAQEWSEAVQRLSSELAPKKERAERRERVKTTLSRAEGLMKRYCYGTARRLLKKAEAESSGSAELEDLLPAVARARKSSERAVRRRNVVLLSTALAVVVLTGGWKVWEVTTRTERKISAVLELPEEDPQALEQKIERVDELTATFEDGEVPERLADAEQRLVRLEELYRQLERLEQHVEGSLGENAPPANAMDMGAMFRDSLNVGVQRFLNEYPEDPTALQVWAKGRRELERLAEEFGCATEFGRDGIVLRVVVESPDSPPQSSLLTHKPGFVSWVQPRCPHEALIRSEGSRLVLVDGKGERLARSIPTERSSPKEYAAEINRKLESLYVATLLEEPEPPEGAEPVEIELDWRSDRSGYGLRVSPGEGRLAVFLVDPEGELSLACPSSLGNEPPRQGDWLVCGSREVRAPRGRHHLVALRIGDPWRPLLEEAAGRGLGQPLRFPGSRSGRGNEAIKVARAIRERLRAGDGWQRGVETYDTLGSDR
jgi:tRNA A-37 threonylcarbamoyl transferase component Bud32